MTVVEIDLDISNLAYEKFSDGSVATEVDNNMFGAIQVNQFTSEQFFDHYDYLDLNLIRFPGGSLAEAGGTNADGINHVYKQDGDEDYYSLDYPDLVNPAAIEAGKSIGFSEVLSRAVETNSAISVILPTIRYTDNPAEAYTAVSNFLSKLFIEGSYNNGILPSTIILDIGNENYDAQSYGEVSISILQAIQDFRTQHPECEFDASFQGITDPSETLELLEKFEGQTDLLAEVDTVRIHYLDHGLEASSSIEDRGKHLTSITYMLEAVSEADPERDLNDVDLFFSAWTATSSDIYGFRGSDNLWALSNASTMLSLFSGMIELGADASAVWGMGAATNNVTALYSGTNYAPAAEIYRMMSESLVGTSLIATSGLDDGYTDGEADSLFNMYAYTGTSQTVIFLAANDLSDEALTVKIDLSGLAGSIGAVWAETVQTVDGEDSGFALITQSEVNFHETTLTYTFEQDYEIVRLIITTEENDIFGGESSGRAIIGGSENDTINGGSGDDTIDGGDGGDTINGGYGNDIISGGSGYDTINGGDGNDTISGDSGYDTINGGNGNDTISGGNGNDTISGGNGNDTIHGGNGLDSLLALSGLNELSGDGGQDLLAGGIHADTLDGGFGNDIIRGEASNGFLGGSDVITGGEGDDIVMGGRGADTFVFRTNDGSDMIGYFDLGDVAFDNIYGYSVSVSGADFQVGIDHVQLIGFSIVDVSNVMSFVTDSSDGAVFSAEGTDITFYGLTEDQLTNGDFLFV